ncbi:butyrophilin subfamily 1 member A1-like [Clarias gariepinus]
MAETSIAQRYTNYACADDDVTLAANLVPITSAVAMEIRWFKGTDCICLYQNRQVEEGKGYEGRVSLFIHELEEGNVSLMLRNVQESDGGEYRCEVTHGERKIGNSALYLYMSGFKRVHRSTNVEPTDYGAYWVNVTDGHVATLPCDHSPKKRNDQESRDEGHYNCEGMFRDEKVIKSVSFHHPCKGNPESRWSCQIESPNM